MKSWILSLVAFLVVGSIAGVQGAYADPISLRVSSGVISCTLTDGGAVSGGCAGSDAAGAGAISWSTAIGDWSVAVNTGIGSSLIRPGSLDLSFIDLSIIPTLSTLTIEFTQTFTSPSFASYLLGVGGTLGAGVDSVTYSAFVDNSNTAFGKPLSGQIGSTLVFSTPGAFSGSTSGDGGGADSLYSLTQVITIKGNGFGPAIASGDATVDAPEPSSFVLLGTGLIGIAGALRRRSKSK